MLCVAAKCCLWLHPLELPAPLPPLLLQHLAPGRRQHRANPPPKRARRRKRRRSERVRGSQALSCGFREQVCSSQPLLTLFRKNWMINPALGKGHGLWQGAHSHNQKRGAVFSCVGGTKVKQRVLRVGLKSRAEDIPNPLCLLP